MNNFITIYENETILMLMFVNYAILQFLNIFLSKYKFWNIDVFTFIVSLFTTTYYSISTQIGYIDIDFIVRIFINTIIIFIGMHGINVLTTKNTREKGNNNKTSNNKKFWSSKWY